MEGIRGTHPPVRRADARGSTARRSDLPRRPTAVWGAAVTDTAAVGRDGAEPPSGPHTGVRSSRPMAVPVDESGSWCPAAEAEAEGDAYDRRRGDDSDPVGDRRDAVRDAS